MVYRYQVAKIPSSQLLTTTDVEIKLQSAANRVSVPVYKVHSLSLAT